MFPLSSSCQTKSDFPLLSPLPCRPLVNWNAWVSGCEVHRCRTLGARGKYRRAGSGKENMKSTWRNPRENHNLSLWGDVDKARRKSRKQANFVWSVWPENHRKLNGPLREVLLMLCDLPFSVIRAKKAWKGFAFIIVLRLWRILRVVISKYSISSGFSSWVYLVILGNRVLRPLGQTLTSSSTEIRFIEKSVSRIEWFPLEPWVRSLCSVLGQDIFKDIV